MRSFRTYGVLVALLSLALGLTAPRAGAVEDGLMGVRIGASYREIMRKFGSPVGVLIAAGGGMVYQTMPSRGLAALAQAGTAAAMPRWADPIRVSFLDNQQAEWVYDMRRARGVMLGIVLSGEGADAVVTDVVIAGFPEYLKNKPTFVRTERGIVFLSTFATVLQRYGFPPQLEVYPPGAAPAAAIGGAGGGAVMRGAAGAAGGGRGGGRGAGGGGGGGGRGMGGGGGGRGGGRGGGGGMRGAVEPGTRLAGGSQAGPTFAVALTQMRGGRGGGGRGGGGGGGRGGGGAGMGGGGRGAGGGGRVAGTTTGGGALPPLGAAVATPASAAFSGLTATAIVDNQVVSFSRDCTLTYNGIAFTLHDMRVIRIHVSE